MCDRANCRAIQDLMLKLPSIIRDFRSAKQREDALRMYLIKMRTAKSLKQIAQMYGVSNATVSLRLKKIREVLRRDFVPLYLTNGRERDELIRHNTTMSRILFCSPESPKSILVCDGTYIYIDKSTNYEFQRNTYSDKKNGTSSSL